MLFDSEMSRFLSSVWAAVSGGDAVFRVTVMSTLEVKELQRLAHGFAACGTREGHGHPGEGLLTYAVPQSLDSRHAEVSLGLLSSRLASNSESPRAPGLCNYCCGLWRAKSRWKLLQVK